MRGWRRRWLGLFGLALFMGVLPACEYSPPPCDVTWVGPVGGDWADGANWDSGSAPSPVQRACAAAGSSVVVSSDAEVRSVEMLGALDVIVGAALHIDSATELSAMSDLTLAGSLRGSGPVVTSGLHAQGGSIEGAVAVLVIGNHASSFAGLSLSDTAQLVIGNNFPWAGTVQACGSSSVVVLGTLTIGAPAAVSSAGCAVSGSPGLTVHQNGSLVVNDAFDAGGIQVVNNGLLAGTGGTIVGSVVNAGTINPGDPAVSGSRGQLTINGDVTGTSTGAVVIDVAGAGPAGTAHDALAVGGTATLDGSLTVARAPGFTIGDATYPFITATAVTGGFASTLLPGSPMWQLDVGGSSVTAHAQSCGTVCPYAHLGGPGNAFGNNVNPANCAQYQVTISSPCGPQPMVWASMSGPYNDPVNGDPYSTKCGLGSAGTSCPQSNPLYRTTGYGYGIDVAPEDVGTPLTLQVYDLGAYPRHFGRSAASAPATRAVTVQTSLDGSMITSPDANFSSSDIGLPVLGIPASSTRTILSVSSPTKAFLNGVTSAGGTYGATIGYDCNSNKYPFNSAIFSTFTSPNWNFVPGFTAGTCQTADDVDGQNMDVQVFDNDGVAGSASFGTPVSGCELGPITAATFVQQVSLYKNNWVDVCTFTPSQAGVYPVRVRNSGFGVPADAGSGGQRYSLKVLGGSGTALYPLDDQSTWLQQYGASATMYLADIPSARYAGQTLDVDIYDPADGNGAVTLQLLGPPGGTPGVVPSGGTVLPAPNVATSCQYNATGSSTQGPATPDVASACQVVTSSGGVGLYNGTWLRFQVRLSDYYSCSTDCFWTLRYNFGTNQFPTDASVVSISFAP